jgi:ABC-type polysaccharide/polyol phosphate export permease
VSFAAMNVQDVPNQGALPTRAPMVISSAPSLAGSEPPIYSAGETISAEVLAGFSAWRVWTILGWDDIRQRYRRSVLGPFWITLSMGMFILLLGVIYSRLFHTDIAIYIPYLSAGLPLWSFISSSTNESCLAFQEGSRIMKQIKLPYSVYVLRVVWRNFIIFLHTIVIFIPVAIIFKVVPTSATLLLVPGLFLVCINVIWLATVLAILSTRYRDILPIVATCIQIMMFATPIMWPIQSLGPDTYIAEINPAYHLIDLVRAPMLGTAPALLSWLIVGGMAIIGSVFATALLANKSRRIVFWV